MAKPAAKPVTLPPPTARQCWWTFAKWVIGLPLLVGASLAFVWFALWATDSIGMSWQVESNTATVLFWLAAISLMYPVMLFIWWSDLMDGLKRARDWEAMTPEARETAIAEAEAAAAALSAKPKRRSRKKTG